MYQPARIARDDRPRLRLLSEQDAHAAPQDRSGPLLENAAVLCLVVPLIALLAVTWFFRWSTADVSISQLFYDGRSAGWPQYAAEPWATLYKFGPYPGLTLGILGALVGVGSYFWARLRNWREMGLFLALLLAIGPGLAINGILKPQWSRPRPVQTKAFGGEHDFVGVWGFGPRGASKSFPSGHASMGFYLMAPAFLLFQRRPRLAAMFLMLGLAGGAFLGLARVAQGQHYASDVLWAGGLVYFSGLLLGYLFHRLRSAEEAELATSAEPVIYQFSDSRHTMPVSGESATEPQTGRQRRAA